VRGRLIAAMATPAAIALIVFGLWAWQTAGESAWNWDVSRPDVMAWALRLAALSAGALGQCVALVLVVSAFYRRRGFDLALRLLSGTVCMVALIGAAVLALVGR
jgi:hypothetical protein